MLSTIVYYCYNRFVDKQHYLKTGLNPGQYYEIEDRVLNALFTTLVDYVEMENFYESLFE